MKENLPRTAILLAIGFAVSGMLLLGLGVVGVAGNAMLYASTFFSGLALLTGFVCIVTFVVGQVINRHQFQRKRLLGLAIACVACIPQFWLGAIGYGLGEMPLLSHLCMYGAGVSVILLVVTMVLILVQAWWIHRPKA